MSKGQTPQGPTHKSVAHAALKKHQRLTLQSQSAKSGAKPRPRQRRTALVDEAYIRASASNCQHGWMKFFRFFSDGLNCRMDIR
jgi:hypothetical protein